jgi:uncharacterized membrane protein YphA (DoxX/SURF4 family)
MTATAAAPGRRSIAATIETGLERWVPLYARLALGAAFLSGVASRFGLWGEGVGYGGFAGFVRYTAEVNAFMPPETIPFLAWAATVAELVLGVALVAGARLRWAALGSAALLLVFGVAMAVSFGIKEPLDYSVFSASAAAGLVALGTGRRPAGRRTPAGRRPRGILAALARGAVPVDGAWVPRSLS